MVTLMSSLTAGFIVMTHWWRIALLSIDVSAITSQDLENKIPSLIWHLDRTSTGTFYMLLWSVWLIRNKCCIEFLYVSYCSSAYTDYNLATQQGLEVVQ